jgi:hypothetical protein
VDADVERVRADETICSATACAPGPGELTKAFPSTPSSVSIRSTPIGSLPSRIANTFRTSVRRSWSTMLTLVMRTLTANLPHRDQTGSAKEPGSTRPASYA